MEKPGYLWEAGHRASPSEFPHVPAWCRADLGFWDMTDGVLSATVRLCGFSECCPSMLGCCLENPQTPASSSVLMPSGAALSLRIPSPSPAGPDLTPDVTMVPVLMALFQGQCCGTGHCPGHVMCVLLMWPWARPFCLWLVRNSETEDPANQSLGS